MPFTKRALQFLRGLKKNNAKPWFEAHRAEYENDVREPMRALIEDMDVGLVGRLVLREPELRAKLK